MSHSAQAPGNGSPRSPVRKAGAAVGLGPVVSLSIQPSRRAAARRYFGGGGGSGGTPALLASIQAPAFLTIVLR